MTSAPAKLMRSTVARRLAQLVLVAAALAFVWRFAARHGADLGRVEWRVDYSLLVTASLVWAISFAGLVLLWSRSLAWWNARMRGIAALRVFFLSNLARYVPGAVWQFAGLAAMSAAQGVSPVAATAAVLWQQAALLGTGTLLAVALSPVALGPAFARIGIPVPSLGARLALALLVVAIAVVLVPRALALLGRIVERRLRDVRAVPRVSSPQMASYLALTTAGWVGYGIAFALFCRAVLGEAAPPFVEAGAIYVAAYVLGILFIIVPGGIGIREGALVASLTPLVGADRALFLAIASRLWLTAIEILGALVVLALRAGRATPIRVEDAER